MLGVTPIAGRTFRESDVPSTVIFSESLWRARFNADMSLMGRSVKLNGVPFTVVGVIPDNAQLARPARMWTLMRMQGVPAFLFGVPPVDPVTFAGVGLLIVLTAAAASASPAWRATHVDPVLMFRAD